MMAKVLESASSALLAPLRDHCSILMNCPRYAGTPPAPEFVNKWVTWGASLRASQFLIFGGKARAILRGRYNVSCEDVLLRFVGGDRASAMVQGMGIPDDEPIAVIGLGCRFPGGADLDGKVLSQDPEGGSEAEEGTTVVIVVGRFEPPPTEPTTTIPNP